MLIPVRCFTCGKVLADKYDYYKTEVETMKTHMGVKRDKADKSPAAPTEASRAKDKAKPKDKGKGKAKEGGGAASVGTAAEHGTDDSYGGGAPTPTPFFDALKTGPILDKMGLTRYCCRRHMLGTVDMMETI